MIFRSSLESKNRPVPHLHFSWFTALCKTMNLPDLAMEFFRDPLAKSSGILDNELARIRYFTLLYKSKMYEDLVQDFELIKDFSNKDDDTIVMAALYHIGTDEAFSKAAEIVSNHQRERDRMRKLRRGKGFRGLYIYSYFAMKRGEFGIAYDVLTNYKFINVGNRLSTNMKLAILTNVERFEEAFTLLRTDISESRSLNRNGKPYKKQILYEAMENLAKGLKASDPDGASNLSKEFTELCRTLDNHAVLVESTLEELVFSEIQSGKTFTESKRREREERQGKRWSRNSENYGNDQGEDDEFESDFEDSHDGANKRKDF